MKTVINPEKEMKDTGIEWVGLIPKNWYIRPLYACLDEINQKNSPIVTMNILSLTNTDGVIPYSERGNQGNKSKENLEDYKVVYPNTIVANSMNILIGSVGLSKYEGCVSPVYYVYSAKSQIDIRYMNYLFQTEPFQKRLRQFANGILNQEQRYQFRKTCRSFVKWYGYITQITRMFDKPLHNEYIFCSYLAKIVPADPTIPFVLGDRVRLEYYNLEKTYEGSIELMKEEKGVYDPAKLKKPVKMVETLSPLEQVIEKINEQYMGAFTEGDRVVITALHQKLKNNKKLMKSAQTDGRQIFENNIFPQLFDDAAQEAYIESTETYTKLFEDAGKYRAIMSALAHALFDELQQGKLQE